MSSSVPSPRFDLADAFPALGELRAKALRDLRTALDALGDHRAAGSDEAHAALDTLVDTEGLDDALAALLEADPGDREAALLRSARMVRHAWGVRGTDPGSAVPPERFEAFFDVLARAERDLLRLCAETPSDAVVWTLRLSTARGLALGPGESRRRWERLHAVEAHDLRAQREYLQHLTPKWGGSWGLVEQHVARVLAQAEPGSAEWSLVPYAQLTRWHDDHDHRDTSPLHDPEVVAALESADDTFSAAPCPTPFAARTAHTDFAVALGLAGRRGRAAAHFARLGPVVDPEGWTLGGPHLADLENIRGPALAEGRRR